MTNLVRRQFRVDIEALLAAGDDNAPTIMLYHARAAYRAATGVAPPDDWPLSKFAVTIVRQPDRPGIAIYQIAAPVTPVAKLVSGEAA